MTTEDNNKQVIVLYHADCLDGFGAAYAAWTSLGDSALYLPVQYGDKLLDLPYLGNKKVYIVDFSYPLEQLMLVAKVAESVVIIDHHTSSKELLTGTSIKELPNVTTIWDDTKSGAVLTWEYFHPIQDVPTLLLHIQDYDLWQFKMSGTRGIYEALTCTSKHSRDFNYWRWLSTARKGFDTLWSDGSLLLQQKQIVLETLAKDAYPCVIQPFGLQGLAVNAPAVYANDLGNILAEQCGSYATVWNYIGAGKYKVSLRSLPGIDVHGIAEYYGGGGHKHAAGFVSDVSKGEHLELIVEECQCDLHSS